MACCIGIKAVCNSALQRRSSALIGLIPGTAISYPLTRQYDATGPSPYLVIPWGTLALVVLGLPLVSRLA